MRRPSLYTVLYLLLLGAAAAFLSRRFGIDAAGTWRSVQGADPGPYLLALLAFYLGFVVRAWRWRLLMQPARHAMPSLLACIRYILIGRFADSVSPAGAGNFYRAYLAAHTHGGAFTRTLGTTAAESVLDVMVVSSAALGVAWLLAAQKSAIPTRQAAVAAAAGGAAVAAGVLVMARWGMPLARRLPARLFQAYSQFHQGVLAGLQHRRLPVLVTLTILGWLLAVARWHFVLAALDVPLSLPMLLFVSLANAVIASIPTTPGGLGVVEPGVGALLALQLPVDTAIAVTLGERLISYVSVVLTGGLLFLSLAPSFRRRGAGTEIRQP